MSDKTARMLAKLMILLVMLCHPTPGLAQTDPDPNSPEPVLLGISLNRIATQILRKSDITRVEPTAFETGSNLDLFIRSLPLMKDEGFTAFRVYAQDSKGHFYRFPTTGLRLSASNKDVFILSITLQDDLGFWEPPAAIGDLLIQVTWRGLASNAMRLGYEKSGGISKVPPIPNSGTSRTLKSKESYSPSIIGYKWSGDRLRFLEQATFGPTAALDSRIRRIGLRTWLAEQFDLPYPSTANPYPNQPLKPSDAISDCDGNQTIPDVPVTCFRDTYTMYPLQSWFFREALYGDAQLRHRVAWALSQIWVTSGEVIHQSRQMVEYHKVLSRNSFGNYRTLMREMTLHPTMGAYLDTVINTSASPNENYARELMQLFTIGLFMLNQDGTLRHDDTGAPIPTYDQDVVNNLTRVFTGWYTCQVVSQCPNLPGPGVVNNIDPMLLNAGITEAWQNRHDINAKTLLNYPGSSATINVPACTNCTTIDNINNYAYNSLDQALDNIYNHPNVAPFVSKRLIQHLVTSDPTPAYIGRVSAVFNANRTNPSQLKEVVKAILLDPEARGNFKTDPNYGKLREPVQYVTNVLRGFNVRSADAVSQSDGVIALRGEFIGMSQIPFQSPTVFNYFPPDYIVPGDAILGPEFAIMTTGTAIQRTNFMNTMVFNRIDATNPDFPNGTSIDLSELVAAATTDPSGNRLLDTINWKLMHGTMSPEMRNIILPVITNVSISNPMLRAQQALYLVSTSSQFQVQR